MAAEEVAAAIDKMPSVSTTPARPACSVASASCLGRFEAGGVRREAPQRSGPSLPDPTSSELVSKLAVRFRSEWGDSADYGNQLMHTGVFPPAGATVRLPRTDSSTLAYRRSGAARRTARGFRRLALPSDRVSAVAAQTLLQARGRVRPLAPPATSLPPTALQGGGDDSYLNEEDRILQQQNDALEFEDLAAGWPE